MVRPGRSREDILVCSTRLVVQFISREGAMPFPFHYNLASCFGSFQRDRLTIPRSAGRPKTWSCLAFVTFGGYLWKKKTPPRSKHWSKHSCMSPTNEVFYCCSSFKSYLHCSQQAVMHRCGIGTSNFTKNFLERMAGPLVQVMRAQR